MKITNANSGPDKPRFEGVGSQILRAVAAIALSAASTVGVCHAATDAGTVIAKPEVKNAAPKASFFPITFWAVHYYTKHDGYNRIISDEQYTLIKECNFNMVMGGPLEQAEKFGLMCMSDAVVNSRDEFKQLWWNGDMPTAAQKQLLVDAVSKVDKTSKSLWGYHLTDEPGVPLYEKTRELVKVVREADPERKVFVNFHPGTDVEKCIKEVNPDLYGYDHYPIFEDGAPLDAAIPAGFDHSNFLNDLARSRKACLESGLEYIATLLACGHAWEYEVEGVKHRRDYGKVTESRVRWQAYSALAYNAGGIAWFTYFSDPNTPEYETPAIGKDWKPTQIYQWLQKVNREVAVIGPMLKQMKSVGTYESRPVYTWQGENEHELKLFNSKGIITGVDGGLVTVGEFVDVAGTTFLLIVNRNVNEPIEIRPQLDWQRMKSVDTFDVEKLAWPVTAESITKPEKLTFSIPAGDGIFLRLNK